MYSRLPRQNKPLCDNYMYNVHVLYYSLVFFDNALLIVLQFKEDGDSMHKLQYVTELSRWLYHNGYPHSDVLTRLSGGIKLCPTDTVQGLDLLLQFNVMCSQCSLSDQLGYCLKATACVVKIMKVTCKFSISANLLCIYGTVHV